MEKPPMISEDALWSLVGWVGTGFAALLGAIVSMFAYAWKRREADIDKFREALRLKADMADLEKLRVDMRALAESTLDRIEKMHDENKAKIGSIDDRVNDIRLLQARTTEQLGRYNAHFESERGHRSEVNGDLRDLRETVQDIRAAMKYGRRIGDARNEYNERRE